MLLYVLGWHIFWSYHLLPSEIYTKYVILQFHSGCISGYFVSAIPICLRKYCSIMQDINKIPPGIIRTLKQKRIAEKWNGESSSQGINLI